MYVNIYGSMFVRVYACIYVCMRAYIYDSIYEGMNLCMHVYSVHLNLQWEIFLLKYFK